MSTTTLPSDPLPLLKAVADPSRLRLLRLLDLEELNVGELARCTDLRQSSVSRHLAPLRAAGLVEERSEGVRTYLSLAEPNGGSQPLVDAVLDLVRGGALGDPEDLRRLEAVRRDRSGSREEFFDDLADDWDALRHELLGGRLAPPEIASLLVPEGLRVVDAGTGTGVLLPWLSALVGPSGSVIAVERSAAMAKRARARAKSLGNVEVRRGQIEDLPVDDGWADALVLSLALGHTKDPAGTLARACRALRPGGRLVVADVEPHGDAALVRSLGRGFAGLAPDALAAAMEAAGLTDVRRVELPAGPSSEHEQTNGARTARAYRVPRLTPLFAVGVVPETKQRRKPRRPRRNAK